MVLDHFHVHQRGASTVGQAYAIAGADEGIGAGLVHSADTPSGYYHCLGLNRVHLAGTHVYRDGSLADTFVHYEGGHEPLLVDLDASLEHLLVHDVKDGLACDVRYEEGAGVARSSERPGAQTAPVISVEDDSHVLQLDDIVGSLRSHDLYGVLITQVVAALYGIEGVGLPGVLLALFRHGGVDAALSGVGVAPHRVDLGDNGYVNAFAVRLKGCSHSGEASTYYKDIVLEQESPLTVPGNDLS